MNATRLLVSVRSVEEAWIALAGGADIIDVKEPIRGSLGMANLEVIQAVVSDIANRVPVSAALGELDELQTILSLTGVSWAKLGLSGMAGQDFQLKWRQWSSKLSPARLLGVCYADHEHVAAPGFEAVLQLVSDTKKHSACPPGILIDTALKDGKGLLYWKNLKTLRRCRDQCHQSGLFLALAGSLTKSDITMLIHEVPPDIIAVRGAACEGNQREGKIGQTAVAELKALIQVNSAK